MSILSLIKEKPQIKYERLFQFVGSLSIFVLIVSIIGVVFIMFYHWYTPWQTDHLVSWPELFAIMGTALWTFIDSIYMLIANLVVSNANINFYQKDLLPFIIYTSIIFQVVFYVVLFFSINFIFSKKYKSATQLTRMIGKLFIMTFILNLIIFIMLIIKIA